MNLERCRKIWLSRFEVHMEYSKIEETNKRLNLTNIKGKDYAGVNQRVIAFRDLFPEGRIITEILSHEPAENGGKDIIIQANVFDGDKLIATGLAQENSKSSYINQTSYVENCETSAVGRALGFVGIGIIDSLATLEEYANAVNNQTQQATSDALASAKQVEFLSKRYKGEQLSKMLDYYKIKSIDQLSKRQASELIDKIMKKDKEKGAST
ncbi:MAG: hypothetical protein MJZ90_10130 [Bacteroidales bacterium]|nr:hypothetical protein [Bacteroidales bacterium]